MGKCRQQFLKQHQKLPETDLLKHQVLLVVLIQQETHPECLILIVLIFNREKGLSRDDCFFETASSYIFSIIKWRRFRRFASLVPASKSRE